MDFLEKIFNICITFPNISLFIFYFIFILLLPIIFIYVNNANLIKQLFILLVSISIVLTESGKPKLFDKLYNKQNNDLTSYISKILISFITLSSILYSSVKLGYEKNNIMFGMIIGLVSLSLFFFLSKELIPVFIEKGDKYMRDNLNLNYKYNWNKYVLGICLIIIFLIFEILLGEFVTRIF